MTQPAGAARAARAARGTTFATSARWRRLIPVAFVTYSLAYLDRSNYAIGVAGGLQQDLQLTSGVAALLGALFFLGYFLFQVPGSIYAERRSVKRVIFWSLLAWGVFAALQGVVSQVWALMVVRFLLGVVEGVVLPGMVIFLSHWFSREERARANAFLILGNPVTVLWMSAISGYLIEATNWRWMFIVEGVPSIVWAFAFRALVQDDPADEGTGWVPDEEKTPLLDRLRDEQGHITPVSGYVQALRSWNVVLLSIQYLLWSIGVYGFIFWLPSILETASHRGIGQIGLLTAVPYALAAILMVVAARLSDRSRVHRRHFVWPWLVGSAVVFYGSWLAGTGQFWVAYVLLVVAGALAYAPYGVYFAYIPEFLPRRVAGAAIALVNSFGALGSFVGAYVVGWLNGATGSPQASFVLMSLSGLVSGLAMFGLRRRGEVTLSPQRAGVTS